MDTLLTGSEKSYDDVRALYLAGAFGSLIRSESAAAIGLISPGAVDAAVPVGNPVPRARQRFCFQDALKAAETVLKRRADRAFVTRRFLILYDAMSLNRRG